MSNLSLTALCCADGAFSCKAIVTDHGGSADCGLTNMFCITDTVEKYNIHSQKYCGATQRICSDAGACSRWVTLVRCGQIRLCMIWKSLQKKKKRQHSRISNSSPNVYVFPVYPPCFWSNMACSFLEDPTDDEAEEKDKLLNACYTMEVSILL